MGTPMPALPTVGRRKTPYGRFWIGKCDSGATGTKESNAGSVVRFICSPGSLQPAQGPEVIARFVEAAAAEGDHIFPGLDDFRHCCPVVLPAQTLIVEGEITGVLVRDDGPHLLLVQLPG